MMLQVSPSLLVLLVVSISSLLTTTQGATCSRSESDIVLAIADSKMASVRGRNGLRLSNGLSRFMKSFISQCDFPKDRLAMVAFSDSTRAISPFSSRRSVLYNSLKSWIPESGALATNMALQSIRNYFSVQERPLAKKVLVLVTPQSSDDLDLSSSEAQILRDDGVTIIGVGYGRDRPSVSELVSLTADRDLVFLTRATKSLRYTVPLIDKAICKQLPEQDPGSAARDDNSDISDISDDNNSELDGDSESTELDNISESDELNIPKPSTIDPIEPMSTMDPIEPMSTMDPIEPVSTMDPIEPMTTMDPIEPMTTMDPIEPITQDPIEPMTTIDPIEPVSTYDPIEPMTTTD